MRSSLSYLACMLLVEKLLSSHFCRHDYGVAPMSTMLDIVKVMQFALSVGKVAVHCHAGLGMSLKT